MQANPTLPGIGSYEVLSMSITQFEMWLRCDSRNVALGESDDTELLEVPAEQFVAKYFRIHNSEQDQNKLLKQLKSDGRYETPVLKSKWDKLI
jgi:hypothetical protein